MRRAYLLVHNDNVGTREEIKAILNAIPKVIHWRTELPNAFFVITEMTANELFAAFRDQNPPQGRVIISEVGSNKQGWLSKESWYLLNNKVRKS
jgi:hypothetical protein